MSNCSRQQTLFHTPLHDKQAALGVVQHYQATCNTTAPPPSPPRALQTSKDSLCHNRRPARCKASASTATGTARTPLPNAATTCNPTSTKPLGGNGRYLFTAVGRVLMAWEVPFSESDACGGERGGEADRAGCGERRLTARGPGRDGASSAYSTPQVGALRTYVSIE